MKANMCTFLLVIYPVEKYFNNGRLSKSLIMIVSLLFERDESANLLEDGTTTNRTVE